MSIRIWVAGAILLSLTLAVADDKPAGEPAGLAGQKVRLAKMQALVGQWRGAGQPQRGSDKDSWIAEADWAWAFENGKAALVGASTGRYFKSLKLIPGKEEGTFELSAALSDEDASITYAGKLDESDRLVLTAAEPRDGLPARISLRFVAGGDRLLMLLEKKSATSDLLTRMAEVGYTRKGSGFGKSVSQRECVVTGGLGTIEVLYEGKTYYVCCTGCRDYFNDNPKEVMAEYFARKEAEKQKKE
jgi:YHS domain-containing protein